jgi:hypothetical protein
LARAFFYLEGRVVKSLALIAVVGLLTTAFVGIPHPPVYSNGLMTVWQIGDVEEIDPATGHYTSYADEFNWQGFGGNPFPPFTNPFVVGTTPEDEFAFGPKTNDGYATDLTIQWYGEMLLGGQLTISWSPGKSGYETKTITFVDTGETAFTESGGYDYQKGWENYPLVEDLMTLSPVGLGWHELRLLHTTGDGTFHDWIRLEAVEYPDEVEIDIKPGSDPNCFNNNGHGVIPVAILGSVTMDVTNIDPATVELDGLKVKRVGRWNKLLAHIEDVTGDGFDDMVVQIQDEAGAFPIGHGTATLTWEFYDGTQFSAEDDICVVPVAHGGKGHGGIGGPPEPLASKWMGTPLLCSWESL